MNHRPPSHRDSIHVEDALILSHQAFAGDQYILRLHAPQCAREARPGSFAHLDCGPEPFLRRPLSIMRADREEGWVEFLYKAVGFGTRALANRAVGERLSLMGPIGVPFRLDPECSRPLLMGGGVGIPPMVFVAHDIHRRRLDKQPLVIMGSEVPFPFRVQASRHDVPGIGVFGAMPLMEEWSIASRLASLQGYSGAYRGYVTDLARQWLDTLDNDAREQVQILGCGPRPMLQAVTALAREYQRPCQISLEEFMACAVGGCAGCTVEIQTPQGPAMKRVCVDGPIFDAYQVFHAV